MKAPGAEQRAVCRRESELLHERVRGFARQALAGQAPTQSFEDLALDIARHQAEHHPVLARLMRYHGSRLANLEDVPAVPADAFRRGRVAAHAPEEDSARFQTSGTTGGAGVHAFRTLETYRELSVSWGRRALLGGSGDPSERVTVLALAAPFEPERRSSLGYMMQELMRDLDGRALADDASFDAREAGRWLLAPGRVDVEALGRGAARAARRGERVLLLGTSFALVWLLDALGGAALRLPARSVVMRTGGFKGHVQALDDAELAAKLARALEVHPGCIVGEYGMTELSSQLYDSGASGPSLFSPPPWLRVTAVDPVSLRPVPEGEVGLARFTDLGNIDSALNVLTQDRVRCGPSGISLLGRQPGSRLRGCSLSAEALSAASPISSPSSSQPGAAG